MNQEKIGKFIALCRKEKKLTQSELAEKLQITNKAVSKWETGRGMPDASLLLDLCDILGISVNELLSGEKIELDNYKVKAEENILVITKEIEKHRINVRKIAMVLILVSICIFVFLVYKVIINLYSSNVFRRIENYDPVFYQTVSKDGDKSIEIDNLEINLKGVWFDGINKEKVFNSNLNLTEEEIDKIIKISNGAEFNMLVEVNSLDESIIHEFLFGYMVYDNNENLILAVTGSNAKVPMYHHFYNKFIKNKEKLKDINESTHMYMGHNMGESIIRDDLKSILFLIKGNKDLDVEIENIDLSKYHVLIIGPTYKNSNKQKIDLSEKVLEFVVSE